MVSPPLNSPITIELPFEEGWEGSLQFRADARRMPAAHCHEELELNLITTGSAVYLLEGRKYECSKHSLLWLFPGQSHILIDRSPQFSYWLLYFRRSLIESWCRDDSTSLLKEQTPKGGFCRTLAPEAARDLEQIFRLVSESQSPIEGNAGLGFAMLKSWSTFLSAPKTPVGDLLHPGVRQAMHDIQHGTHDATLAELARRAHMTETYLCALFKKEVGIGVAEYRNQVRIERFLTLCEARRVLADAAFEAGFGSYAQFYKIFSAKMGMSPSEYVAQLQLPRAD
jgi:AraC-like DNA-binding protein